MLSCPAAGPCETDRHARRAHAPVLSIRSETDCVACGCHAAILSVLYCARAQVQGISSSIRDAGHLMSSNSLGS